MLNNSASNDGRALRPRARILRTLGEELISSETVAVLELIKNAYDADARLVLVRFVDSLEAGQGCLDIIDDGHGMDLSTVQSAWMEPATDIKKKARHSKFLGRRLLGEKGVGRFASARLAQELELVTRAADSATEIYAFFDWTQFDREDLYLDEVMILAEERLPKEVVKGRSLPMEVERSEKDLPRDGSHGTILHMNHLKRSWASQELDDLKRGLSRLVSPFEAVRDFRIFLQLPDDLAGAVQELEPPKIVNYPHYTIDGDIAADGRFSLTIQVHAEGRTENSQGWYCRKVQPTGSEVIAVGTKEDLGNTRSLVCGPFSFRILVWDRDQLDNIDQKLGTGIRNIRKDLDSVAGISIYRDGFRVLPYGEPENDWLRLDIRRVQNPTLRLSNNQLTGYIKIGADTNPLLKDQSNREGLDNNESYADLQGVMLLCLVQLETVRYNEKKSNRNVSRGSEDDGLLNVPNVADLRLRIVALHPDQATLRLFDDKAKEWEDQIGRIREVLSRYHSLATLGQLIDKVVHDSRQPLSTIQGQAALAQDQIAGWIGNENSDAECKKRLLEIDGRLGKVRAAAGLIDAVLRRIEPLGGRRRGRPKKLYLEEIIQGAFAHFDSEIKDLGVSVTLPKDVTLVSVDSAELQEVLINLLSNSLYWLSQVPKEKRAILVKCERPKLGQMEIIFADSGPGIPRKNRAAIFDPYFSTKPNGVGLGLVIAGEIVRDYYDGALELLDSGPLGGAVFKIILRKRV